MSMAGGGQSANRPTVGSGNPLLDYMGTQPGGSMSPQASANIGAQASDVLQQILYGQNPQAITPNLGQPTAVPYPNLMNNPAFNPTAQPGESYMNAYMPPVELPMVGLTGQTDPGVVAVGGPYTGPSSAEILPYGGFYSGWNPGMGGSQAQWDQWNTASDNDMSQPRHMRDQFGGGYENWLKSQQPPAPSTPLGNGVLMPAPAPVPTLAPLPQPKPVVQPKPVAKPVAQPKPVAKPVVQPKPLPKPQPVLAKPQPKVSTQPRLMAKPAPVRSGR